jgi:hypothetical protein
MSSTGPSSLLAFLMLSMLLVDREEQIDHFLSRAIL